MACEDCSREFEAYESRFFGQYEPAGKAIAAAAKEPLPDLELERFYEGLKARLSGDCSKVEGSFAAFAGGEMEKGASENVASHLQSCEPCSKSFEGYESKIFGQYEAAGKALAAARAIEPPDGPMAGFYDRVMAGLELDRSRSFFRRSAWSVNAAAILLIGLSVGVLMRGQPAKPAAPESQPVAGNVDAAPSAPSLPPAESPTDVRRFAVDNVRSSDFYGVPGRRAGSLEVLRPDGNHGVDEARPLADGDSVGF